MTFLCELRNTPPPQRWVSASHRYYGKLYHRQGSRFGKRRRTTLRRARIRGVIIWLVNFYCARTGHLFLLYEGHYAVASPLLSPESGPYFSFLPSLGHSPASSQPPPLFLFPWHRFTYRDKDLHRAYSWETRSSSFWCPFPAAFVQRSGLFLFTRFSVKHRIKRYSQSDVYPDIISPGLRHVCVVSIYEFFGDMYGISIEKPLRRVLVNYTKIMPV